MSLWRLVDGVEKKLMKITGINVRKNLQKSTKKLEIKT